VNLAQFAAHFSRNTKIESNYRRIQSFFKEVKFDCDRVSHWSIEQMLSNKGKFYLAIDQANWQFGKAEINILMLSEVYKGIDIPLYWEMLPHQGNSKPALQIKLAKRFVNQFGTDSIAVILGDRKFFPSTQRQRFQF